MNWQTIEGSKALTAAGYDPSQRVLGVETHEGRHYFYQGVTPKDFDTFQAEPSKGKAWAWVKKTFAQCHTESTLKNGDGTLTVPAPGPKLVQPAAKPAAKAPVVMRGDVIGDSMALTIRTSLTATLAERLEEFCAPIAKWVEAYETFAAALPGVTDGASYTTHAELATAVADERRHITKMLQPTKRAIDSVKQVFLDKEHELVGRLEALEDRLGKSCTEYRVAEQRRANEAAEAERQRKLKEAEDARIHQAELAEAAGKTKLADALLSTPVTAPKVEVKADVPKGAGTARVNWKWRVTDATKIPLEYWLLDEVKIGQRVRADKDKTAIPGIEAYPEDSTNF